MIRFLEQGGLEVELIICCGIFATLWGLGIIQIN
jgi:hypothetical protein